MKTVSLVLRIALAAFVALTIAVVPAGASTDISIPFDKLVFGPPGSVHPVAEVAVDAELVGQTCVLAVQAENQSSVHPGNDLIVSTGASQAVVVGVEDTANGGTNQTYDMLLGSTILVQIRIGQDGMSSLGFGLSFDCAKPLTGITVPPVLGQQLATTTTLPPPETTTTQPPVTAPPAPAQPTTTTAPPSQPDVAGAVANGLPETPAAKAVTAAPAYTG